MTIDITIHPLPSKNLSPYQLMQPKAPDIVNDDFFGEGGLSFESILDTLNPLQHIPIVSDIYKEITGDTISIGSKIVGGTILGGPIGLFAAVFSEIVSEVSGGSISKSIVNIASNKYELASKLS
ncbi:MAG: hypothetical protein R3D71_07165 [Rickettsiales bacterium]